jgi:hypothetical protein
MCIVLISCNRNSLPLATVSCSYTVLETAKYKELSIVIGNQFVLLGHCIDVSSEVLTKVKGLLNLFYYSRRN